MAASGVIQSYGVILGRRPSSSRSSSASAGRGPASVTGKIGSGKIAAGKRQRDRIAAARARRTQVSGKITSQRHKKEGSCASPDDTYGASTVAECLWTSGAYKKYDENMTPSMLNGQRQQRLQQQPSCRNSRKSSSNLSNSSRQGSRRPVSRMSSAISNSPFVSSAEADHTSRRQASQNFSRLALGGWGGLRGSPNSFPNIRVRCLRSGRQERRISDYCRGKVCVIDFWMTKHGRSPIVSMDA